jgi:hypothetical protein
MSGKAVAATAVVLAISLGVASPAAAAVDTMGIGAQPCRVFLAQRDGPRKNEFLAWILGYLSGLAVERDQDMLRDQTSASVLARAVQLCKRDPEAYLDDVLDDF